MYVLVWYFLCVTVLHATVSKWSPWIVKNVSCFVTELPANVAYQEFSVPMDFPFHLRQFLPNVFYFPHSAEDLTQRSVENEFVSP